MDWLLKTEPYSKRADLLLALGECQCRLGNPREGRESFQTAAQIDEERYRRERDVADLDREMMFQHAEQERDMRQCTPTWR